jgi:SAM-dependent methyltransferase
MNCRHCHAKLDQVFLDLGCSPPSNAYLTKEDLNRPEVYYPLRLFVCNCCWLVQTEDFARADELFRADYAYFSSTSLTWLEHAARYCESIISRLSLDKNSYVVEIASNDGYLLKNFVKAGIPCLGIEPTESTAKAAELLGIPVVQKFFGETLGKELANSDRKADLILGNNVYAHVPDINDFTKGLAAALKPNGVVTLEFPHLMRMVEFRQFDTVYHEHYSYLSLQTVSRIFESSGLRIFDVEELSTHGGSLRVYGCLTKAKYEQTDSVGKILNEEVNRGMKTKAWYANFQKEAEFVKDGLLSFLLEQKKLGKKIAAYGAAAKGNTLINFAGIKKDLVPFVCDAAKSKQEKFLPGSRIPIREPKAIEDFKPDFILILPWNIGEEIKNQLSPAKKWGAKFVVGVPFLSVLN